MSSIGSRGRTTRSRSPATGIALIDRDGRPLSRRQRRRGGLLPRPRPPAGDRGDQGAGSSGWPMPIPASSPASRPSAGRPADRGARPRASSGSTSSPAARRRSRRRSRWRASTSSRSASRSAATSSRGARAITATRWARSRSAATPGGAAQFEPLLIDVAHVSPCYAYRGQARGRDATRPTARASRPSSRRRSSGSGPRRVIGFVAEPVVGATLGAVPAVPGYFEARPRDLRSPRHAADPRRGDVRHGPHRHAVRLRAGGRAPRSRDRSPRGSAPAISRSARRWSRGAIFEAIRDGSGFFQHGHTYMGHPLACAAALAVQQTIAEEQLLGRVRQQGERLRELLRGALRRASARRRDPRARPVPGPRVRRRPREQAAVRAGAPAARADQGARRWRAACCAIRWAARSTASAATICCWRRRSSSATASSRRSSTRLAQAIDAALDAGAPGAA